MNNIKIACIAGTPIDTQMGIDVLLNNGFEADPFPSSNNPTEETIFQMSSFEYKNNKIKILLEKIKKNNYDKVFVYCNSLSAAIDFKQLSKEFDIEIITPFDVYNNISKKYNVIGIIAANSIANSKIEKVFIDNNKNIEIYSVSMLPVVWSIEKKIKPNEIIKKHNLDKLCDWFNFNKCEILLLGCTHFPYIYEELKKITTLNIIEPSKQMINMLKN